MTEQHSALPHEAPRVERVSVGVVLSRKKADSPWADHIWEPVEVMLDPPAAIHGKVCAQGPGWKHYFVECEPLELHRKDAAAYRESLAQVDGASLWVVLVENEDSESDIPWRVHLVTASAYEAQDYLDCGELLVDSIVMPERLAAHIADFVARCPQEEQFIKRKQKKKFSTEHTFGQQSLQELRALKAKEH